MKNESWREGRNESQRSLKSQVKNLPTNTGDIRDLSSVPGLEDPLEEHMIIHSSILAWRIPWTEEPGGLQSMGLQTLEHD